MGSDHLAVAELDRYLRGRTREDIVERLCEGAEAAGVHDVAVYPDELAALRAMLGQARGGDVVGVTALGMRPEIFAGWKTPAPGGWGRPTSGGSCAGRRLPVRERNAHAPTEHPCSSV